MKQDEASLSTILKDRGKDLPRAEEIRFTNLSLQKTPEGEISIFFNVSWSDSWRWDDGNWDAAWVFLRFETDTTDWAPVHVSPVLGESHAPPDATVMPAEDGMGAFVYRSADNTGFGDVDFQGVELRLAADSLPSEDVGTFTLAICGLRMVYIPAGPFWAGDPTGSDGPTSCFYDPSLAAGENRAYCVDSEDEIRVAPEGDEKTLYYDDSAYGGDQEGPIPEDFPKGYDAFYIMHSQATQGDYSQFLNLVDSYTVNIHYQWGAGAYRFTIWSTQVNPSVANRPRRPCNWLSWGDGTAFACWAGLRPMTELEFEKACRGAAAPVRNEFAWGDTDCDIVNVILGDESTSEELACGNCNIDNDNVVLHGGDGGSGPIRAAAFLSWHSPVAEVIYMGQRANFAVNEGGDLVQKYPTVADLRQWNGVSYYGVGGLSGNLWEQCVSVGSPQGREFTGKNGTGILYEGSAPDAELEWPGLNGRGNSYRGGSWYTTESKGRVADRSNAGGWPNFVYRSIDTGFRCVRSAPEASS